MMFPGNLVQFLLEFIHKVEQFVFPVVRKICLGYFFPDAFNCSVRHFLFSPYFLRSPMLIGVNERFVLVRSSESTEKYFHALNPKSWGT